MSVLDDLDARLGSIERQLRGDPRSEPIDLAALPVANLQDHLETNWWPQGHELVEPHSIQAEQIGELPTAKRRRTNAVAVGLTYTVLWETTDWDTGGMSNPAGTAFITVRTPGKYIVIANWEWAAGVGGARLGVLFQNGTAIATDRRPGTGGAGDLINVSISAEVHAKENDTFSVQVTQNLGGPLNLNTATLSAHWVGS
jgi:hypothetical protein